MKKKNVNLSLYFNKLIYQMKLFNNMYATITVGSKRYCKQSEQKSTYSAAHSCPLVS